LTALELLRELTSRGVRLRVEDERLVVTGPKGAVDPELAAGIRARKSDLISLLGRSSRALPLIEPRGAGRGIVLHPTQERFLHLMRLTPDQGVFAVPGAWRIRGRLDVASFERAVQRLVDRHEILRYRFILGDDEPGVELVDAVQARVGHDDLSTVPDGERQARLRELLERHAYEEIDLSAPPPIRVRLVKMADDDHVFLFVAHSAVWDGWSFDIMLSELRGHYLAAQGLGPEPDPPPLHFADFAHWHREALASGRLSEGEAYWRRRLAPPMPSLGIPTDRPRKGPTSPAGARVPLRVGADVLERVREVSKGCGATPYMVALAALKIVLGRYGGIDDVTVASPLQGREDPKVENVIGVFVNTLFFRTRLDPAASFRALLSDVQRTAVEAVEHQLVPGDRVTEMMRQDGITRSPYELVFIFQQTRNRATEWGPLQVAQENFGADRVGVDIQLWMREFDDFMDGGLDFRTELFDHETIDWFRQHFIHTLARAVAQPDRPIGELDIRTPEEVDWHASLERRHVDVVRERLDGKLGDAAGVRILDAVGRPAPTSVFGEIHMLSPLGDLRSTGRRGRWTSRGELQLDELERSDPGIRRVEAALATHEEIREACALVRQTPDGANRLVAYVVWSTTAPPLVSELRRFLVGRLPAELVPGMIVEVDALPRAGDGSIDTSDLPNPYGSGGAESRKSPATKIERMIAEVWTHLLGVDEVRLGDNFFELGGHSLLAVEAVAMLERRLGMRVDARSTFFLSLGQIAAQIESSLAARET
jgi:hypothetical protein